MQEAKKKLASMTISHLQSTVNDSFFQPLAGLAEQSPHSSFSPDFSDQHYLSLGVQRILECSDSGRGFLQEHGARYAAPTHSTYFYAFQSERRLEMLRDVSRLLLVQADSQLADRLATIPELNRYQCFAMDGHWHKAAAHDLRHDGTKMAVGHFYSLNLRTHSLRHLTAGEGLHEHDMSALKRIKPKGLRAGVPKGTRTIIIYDKAAIDYRFWKRCRQECAIYFISRAKKGMAFELVREMEWDRTDPGQNGITGDRLVNTNEGDNLRIVSYTDPRTGESYQFLTNEMDLSPGVIAELYRRRWEAEKVFDEIKNKLGEKKAWASSLTAKTAQAQFIAITHNLLLIYEQQLQEQHGVKNEAEDKRRAQRADKARRGCAAMDQPVNSFIAQAQGATQRSVKLIRWLRDAIHTGLAETIAVPQLKVLYARL